MNRKPILCLDFDGVLHSYRSGWQGAGRASDPPVEGALEFLHEATRHFRVMIYSSRSKSLAGRRAMKRFVREHFDLSLTFSPDHEHDWLHEAIEYPWFKPPAVLTIDDRALTFDGTWPDMATIKGFKPWNKRPTPATHTPAPVAVTGSLQARSEASEPLPSSPTEGGLRAHCHANRDGDCRWIGCPQLHDAEPEKSGRHCPLDTGGDDV